MKTPIAMAAVPSDFDEVPTRVDINAAAMAHAYWMRVEFHVAMWELDELYASWAATATNYSDDFSDGERTVAE